METYPTTYLLRGVVTDLPRPSRPLKESINTNTLVWASDANFEQRRVKSPPTRTFDISYLVIGQDAYFTLRNFFIARCGQQQEFLWMHPVENIQYKVRFTADLFSGEPFGHHPKLGELYKLAFQLKQVL